MGLSSICRVSSSGWEDFSPDQVTDGLGSVFGARGARRSLPRVGILEEEVSIGGLLPTFVISSLILIDLRKCLVTEGFGRTV